MARNRLRVLVVFLLSCGCLCLVSLPHGAVVGLSAACNCGISWSYTIIPTLFKKRWGYCYRLRPSIMLSPPKPLDKIQPNLVCELLT